MDFARLDQSVALSMLAGAQVMVLWFRVIIANAYGERGLWLHAAGTSLALVAVGLLASGNSLGAQTTLLLLLALAGLQLRALVSHVDAIQTQRLWLTRVSAWLLPPLAVVSAFSGEHLLQLGVLAWAAALRFCFRGPGPSACRGRSGSWRVMWPWPAGLVGSGGARSRASLIPRGPSLQRSPPGVP